ncbi:MAG: GNAT family N-acetyltransferase [Phycisphaerales bacterium]|nr:GNAT family N-acetyltransferase [Phycisphaerales bacterium]
MHASDHATFEIMRDADIATIARVMAHAFAGTRESSAQWLTAAGLEHMRVLRTPDGSTPACLMRIPMAQFYGGRSVPMVGIAGVGVAPEARGRGHAAAMMRACVQNLHDEGVALSGLYCSTQALYRRVGYEQAGLRYQIRLPISRISVPGKARNVRPLEKADEPLVRACYAAYAPRFDGALDRGAYCWGRVACFREVEHYPFGFFNVAGDLEGYVYLSQQRLPTGRHEVWLTDLAFLTPDAGRQILAFFADFEPTADTIVFHGSPAHPLLALLPQQRYSVEFKDVWMIRVTHLERALTSRGYNPGVSAAVTLDLHDDIIASHTGRWTIGVEDGRGTVARGGEGPVLSCTIRGLAAMYSGLFTPTQARMLGWCSGGDEAMHAAGAIFHGSMPWMIDQF